MTTTDRCARPLLPVLGWTTGAMFFFYAWVHRVAPSVIVDDLMRDFAVGGTVLGSLSAAYFYGYAGMQIPVGMLLDRFGPRRLMTIAACVAAAASALFATADSLATASLARFLIGASCAFSLVGAMAVAGQWFEPRRFAMLSGFAMAMGMAGGVFGQAPLRLAVEASDWRSTTMALTIGGIVIAIAAFATVRDRRRGSGSFGRVLAGLGTVARDRATLTIAVAGLLANAPLLGFGALWGVPFLETAYGLDRTTAALVTSMLFIGWGIGSPLLGWLSDHIGVRRPPLLAGLVVQLVALVALIYVPGLPLAALIVLALLVGFGGSSLIVGFALVREMHPAGLSGTAIGLLNGMMTGSGALYQPLLGLLLDLGWNGAVAGGARVYDADTYRMAFSVLVIGVGVACLCVLAVRETYCKPAILPAAAARA